MRIHPLILMGTAMILMGKWLIHYALHEKEGKNILETPTIEIEAHIT